MFAAGDPRQREKNIGEHFKYDGGPTGPYDKSAGEGERMAKRCTRKAHLEGYASGVS